MSVYFVGGPYVVAHASAIAATGGDHTGSPLREITALLELHQEHDLIEFCGMVSRIARGIPAFFQSHTSVVVNLEHIKSIDEANRKIELTNGRIVPIAVRKTKGLLDLMATMS